MKVNNQKNKQLTSKMNLSIRNFAVMALLGIASASSDDGTEDTCGKVSLPNPAQYASRNWTDEQQANYNYLSQCSGADGVTMAEGVDETLSILMDKLVDSGDLADLGQASIQQFFDSLDLDSDTVITRREFMQYMRSVKAPVKLAGLSAPYKKKQSELFKYMSCAYDEDCSSISYQDMLQRTVSRANFKAMTPILKPGLYGDK